MVILNYHFRSSGGLHLGVVGPFLKVTILALKNLVSIIMRTSSRPDHYTAGLLCKYKSAYGL